MKNLIRGHIYQLKRDNFFFGCLALSFGFLMISVRHFSSGPESTPTMGVDSFLGSFLSGDIILYAFMLLTANIVAEAYRSGAMKTIVGRGVAKKKYYLSIALTISAAYLLVMLISGIVMGMYAYNRFGMGTVLYPSYYALSVAARVLFVIAHISFVITMTILTRNAIAGFVFGLVIPNIPQILEMVLGFLKINIELDLFKISAHMPTVYEASNDLSSFLPCFVLLSGYLIVSIVAGFWLLKYQDIK